MAEYLKTECAHCGVHIEFPAALFGTETECPHCHAQTLLSGTEEAAADEPAEQPPPIVPQPPVVLAATDPQPQAARRHGAFYYGCMGTLGVFAALALLALICIAVLAFFVGAPAFFEARARAQKAVAVSEGRRQTAPLPPLNDEQKAYVERLFATGKLSEQHDSIEDDYTVDVNKNAYDIDPSYTPPLQLSYYRTGKTAKPRLNAFVTYRGERMIVMDNIKCRLAGTLWEVPLKSTRQGIPNRVLEMGWLSVDDQKEFLSALLASTETVQLRLSGREGNRDEDLGSRSLQMMRDVFLAYRYHGGEW